MSLSRLGAVPGCMLGGVALMLGATPDTLAGQDPDSLAVVPDSLAGPVADSLLDQDAPGNCLLTWESVGPDTRSLSQRDGPELHITYVSGRMRWTCGAAVMEADSAVKTDRLRKVDLFGNVVYRDSIRTLQSRLLEYFEVQDLVIAREEVELVRLVDNSSLTGPRVEFLRAVSGVDEQTTATGRPHMTFFPEGEDPGEPFEIDADRAVFAGENEGRFHGDVILSRPDLHAEADSAYLTRDDEVGIMWGSPWVESQEIRLEGDTIRFRSEDEELKDVHAAGNGFAVGEQFEIRSDLIDIALANEEVEEVWAHGDGLSEALSGEHLLYGDSLRFAMFASQIDTVFSVGDAVAIQGDSTAAASGLAGVSPISGQLDRSASATDSSGLATDSIGLETDSTGLAPADSAEVAVAGPADEPPELMEEVLQSAERGSAVDSGKTPAEPEASDDHRGPRLGVGGSTNWVAGDTLIAIFERPGRPEPAAAALEDPVAAALVDSLAAIFADSVESVLPDSLSESVVAALADSLTALFSDSVAAVLTAVALETLADSSLALPGGLPPIPPTSSLVDIGAGQTAPADSTGDPVMEHLTVIGNARSFYRQVRDTTATERPSRNYMVGRRIDIAFEEGEPRTVRGEDAIGIYLEPEESVPVEGSSAGTPSDTSAATPDSTGVRPDSLRTRSDTLDVRPDSLRVRPDTLGVRPDPVRRARSISRIPPQRSHP